MDSVGTNGLLQYEYNPEKIIHAFKKFYFAPSKSLHGSYCAVFLVLSVSRALGIPCRVVTNFLSAHDTNSNLTIERYIDENGELVQSRDMIWSDIFELAHSPFLQNIAKKHVINLFFSVV